MLKVRDWSLRDWSFTAAAAKSLQSCLTLCDHIDGSPPGSAILGILQARTLEWVAISFSNAWKWKGKVKSLSRVWLFATPWTEAYQGPLSMGFSRQECWSGVPLLSLLILHSVQFSSVQLLSRVWLWVTPWTVAHRAPPSMGFSRQEYWSGVPLPSPKEGLVPKNWCFWTVVLEKTFESPLDCQEIKPINPKGNQS